MQAYRRVKPHSPDGCAHCGPFSPGHHLCQHDGCQEIATTQTKRHATAAEHEATAEAFKPIDGILHVAVFACDEHGEDLDPFCSHPAAEPVPCPKCQATGTDQCVKQKSGKQRSKPHQVRIDVQPAPPPPCRCAHREDCEIFTGCACSKDDESPVRPKRIVEPPPPPGPAPIHLPVHGPMRDFLVAHGIDVDRVVGNELQPKGDGSSTMVLTTTMVIRQANGDLAYDDHGRPRTEISVIELVIPRPMDPVDPATL